MPQIVQADTSAPSIEGLELTQGKTYEFEGAGKVGDEKTTPLGTIVQLLLLFRGTGGPKLARLAAGWALSSVHSHTAVLAAFLFRCAFL